MLAKKYSKILVAIIASIFIISILFSGCTNLAEETTEKETEEVVETEEEPTEKETEKQAPEEEETEEAAPKEETETKEEGTEPAEGETGEFFVNAILKSYDLNNNTLAIEQLINEPNEKEVGPKIDLAEDYEVIRSILIKKEATEEEYQNQISLDKVPLGTEVGIKVEDGKAVSIISQFFIDAVNVANIQEVNPDNEFFIYAILKDIASGTIKIEQLINEPNEKEFGPELSLAGAYKAYISVVVRNDEGEKEYVNETSLGKIPLGSEVGIIVDKDGQARAIIYSMAVE